MNERIKQLAKQADSYAISMEKETGAFYFDSYNQKFAELIVRECASHLNWVGDDAAGIELLEHFGVEE